MSCERYQAILKQTALGSSPTPELEAHLRACATCARRMADEKRLVAEITASLETAMSAPPSAGFLAIVRGRVAEERARVATGWPGWLSNAAASLPVVVVVIGVALIGAGVRRHLPPDLTDSGTPPTPVTAPAAAAEPGPAPGIAVHAASPATGPSPRRRPESRAAGERARSRLALEAGVLVEPGQLEALARLAERGLRSPTRSTLAVEILDEAPLPQLRPADLPRFEAKRLEVNSSGWQQDQTWEVGGVAPVGDEGSDS